MVTCECGYVATGRTEDEVVENAQRHARQAHGMDIPRERILALASRQASAATSIPD